MRYVFAALFGLLLGTLCACDTGADMGANDAGAVAGASAGVTVEALSASCPVGVTSSQRAWRSLVRRYGCRDNGGLATNCGDTLFTFDMEMTGGTLNGAAMKYTVLRRTPACSNAPTCDVWKDWKTMICPCVENADCDVIDSWGSVGR